MNGPFLKKGDKVWHRDCWGREAPAERVVMDIYYDPTCNAGGDKLDIIAWDDMRVLDKKISVDLDDLHWAYGNQLYPNKEAADAFNKEDFKV